MTGGLVVIEMFTSLDGYATGPNVGLADPMGEGGEPLPQPSSVATCANEGVAQAGERARAAAGPRNARLMGADVSRQALAAGLVDEIDPRLVPVLLGAGTRLFDRTGGPTEIERVRVVDSPAVTHLSFRPRR